MVMPSEYQIQFRHLISQLVIIWISHMSECDHHVTSILYFQYVKIPSRTIHKVLKHNLVHGYGVEGLNPCQLSKTNEPYFTTFMFDDVIQLCTKQRLHFSLPKYVTQQPWEGTLLCKLLQPVGSKILVVMINLQSHDYPHTLHGCRSSVEMGSCGHL